MAVVYSESQWAEVTPYLTFGCYTLQVNHFSKHVEEFKIEWDSTITTSCTTAILEFHFNAIIEFVSQIYNFYMFP